MATASLYLRHFSLNKEPYPLGLTRQQALSSTLSFDKDSTLEPDLAECHLMESMTLTFIANDEHGHGKPEGQTLKSMQQAIYYYSLLGQASLGSTDHSCYFLFLNRLSIFQ